MFPAAPPQVVNCSQGNAFKSYKRFTFFEWYKDQVRDCHVFNVNVFTHQPDERSRPPWRFTSGPFPGRIMGQHSGQATALAQAPGDGSPERATSLVCACSPQEGAVRREGARRAPRAGDNEDGIAMLKLKDWPPDSDFSVELVRHNQVWV